MVKVAPPETIIAQLQEQGYSEYMIEELWKWYDFSEKKGIASF